MDARELSEYLARNVETVVNYLLPSGKREGREWVAGSVNGEQGKSLKICLEGKKAGLWADFAGNEKGDLLDLWRSVRSVSLTDAIREAKQHFHITEPEFSGKPKKAYSRPTKPQCQQPKGKVFEYLTHERKLTLETLKAFQVAASMDDAGIIFPSKRDGELLSLKTLKLARTPEGKKQIFASQNSEPCLFGWQAIPVDARTIAITEGEFDAMSLHQYGIPALSVPFGVNNFDWVSVDWLHLEQFSMVYICFDMDEPGQKAAMEAVKRLGRHRCKIVKLPAKDANACLQSGYSADTIQQTFDNAVYLEPAELKKPTEFLDEVLREFYPTDEQQKGVSFPWEKLKDKIRLRPSEISIWTGVNGHGKSQLLGHVMIEAVRQGEKVCIASFEIKPRKLLFRLVRQLTCQACPSESQIRDALDWLNERFWIFDLVGTTNAQTILDVFTYARKRFGINQFVIDSLMKCGIPEDDYRGQKLFVDQLCDFKNEHNCHVHLVAHARKGESEHTPVGKLDVKGTGALTDLVDNVFSVWRNKKKEDDAGKHKPDEKIQSEADAKLRCDKQRNGDWEGKANLWFDRKSYQYLQSVEGDPLEYLKRSKLSAISWTKPLETDDAVTYWEDLTSAQ